MRRWRADPKRRAVRKYVCMTLAVATGTFLAISLWTWSHRSPPAPPREAWTQLQRDLLELSQSTGLRPATRLLKPEQFVHAANQLNNDLRLTAPGSLPPPETTTQIKKVASLADLCRECAKSVFYPNRDQDDYWAKLQSCHRLLLIELPVAIEALDQDLEALPHP